MHSLGRVSEKASSDPWKCFLRRVGELLSSAGAWQLHRQGCYRAEHLLFPSSLYGWVPPNFIWMPGTATSPSPPPGTSVAMTWSRDTNAASLFSPQGIFLFFHCLKQEMYKQGPTRHEKCDLSCSGNEDATAWLGRSAQVTLEQVEFLSFMCWKRSRLWVKAQLVS